MPLAQPPSPEDGDAFVSRMIFGKDATPAVPPVQPEAASVRADAPGPSRSGTAEMQSLLELLQALKQPAQPLSLTAAQQEELQSFAQSALKRLSESTELFARLMPARELQPRLLRFERDAKKPRHWVLAQVRSGDPVGFDPQGIEGLEDALQQLCSRPDAEAEASAPLALWMCGAGEGSTSLFFCYVALGELRTVFLGRDGAWLQVPMQGAALAALVRSALTMASRSQHVWDGFTAVQARYLSQALEEPVQAWLAQQGLPALTSAQWHDLSTLLHRSRQQTVALQQAAQLFSHDWVREAHRLLWRMAHIISDWAREVEQLKKETVRDADKKLKRLRSDLERATILSQGMQARCSRLEQENKRLAQQLHQSKLKHPHAGERLAGTSRESVAQTLQGLFGEDAAEPGRIAHEPH